MMKNVDLTELLRRSAEGSKSLGEGSTAPKRIRVYERPDPKAIREALNLSQSKFAAMLGISKRTLEGWEQGRRVPAGPARRLLDVAKRFPSAVYRTAFEQTRSVEVGPNGGMIAVWITPARPHSFELSSSKRVSSSSSAFTNGDDSSSVEIPVTSSRRVTEHGKANLTAES